ncbi:ParM/StbA family protein [Noviherbaspirillum malthae]|uniref:ParM/StbA family protein n=1 Tax=Noviherbaspirillum malthae TaxID=1260987 RepID=UPI00188E55BC|nr:ParM/StbA family protein [Noviherbaspirillum malthae]
MEEQTIVALDAGRSAMKAIAYANGIKTETVIPSIVAPWESISDDAQAEKAEIETVEVFGRKYFCGETARIVSGTSMMTGLDDNWHTTKEYRALCLAAIKKLVHMGVPGLTNPLVIVGTPAKLFQAHRAKHQEVTAQTINGTVRAISQPMGAYFSYLLDDRGVPHRDRLFRKNGSKRSWGIIEIGHFTTDFVLIREGAPIDNSFRSCEGMSVASDRLMQILTNKGYNNQTPLKCATSLVTGTVSLRGEDVSVSAEVNEAAGYVAERILTMAINTFSAVREDLDGFLIGGGGASLIFPHLQGSLHNAVLLENPRMAVAEGYIKFGTSAILRATRAQKLMVEANG